LFALCHPRESHTDLQNQLRSCADRCNCTRLCIAPRGLWHSRNITFDAPKVRCPRKEKIKQEVQQSSELVKTHPGERCDIGRPQFHKYSVLHTKRASKCHESQCARNVTRNKQETRRDRNACGMSLYTKTRKTRRT